jgi:hypothetical protein
VPWVRIDQLPSSPERNRLNCRATAHFTPASAALVVLLAGCSPFKSEVPIITVDTHGRAIFDQPKVAAEMAIHYDPADSTQTLTSRVDYQGAIGIEYIGHSSLRFRKKSYGLVLRDPSGGRRAAPLLGLPSDSNWVLHGPYADKTLMRNYLAYALAARLHLQGPRTCFVEMFLRQGRWGLTYQGVYLLVEASGRSPEILRIARLQPGDTTGSAISGGYILEVDRLSRGDDFFTLPGDPMSTHRDTVGFIVPRRPQPVQKAWLANYFGAMESSLPPTQPPRYSQYLDVDSFVDFMLLQEALKNVDAYRFSASMHKDRNGKLRMGTGVGLRPLDRERVVRRRLRHRWLDGADLVVEENEQGTSKLVAETASGSSVRGPARDAMGRAAQRPPGHRQRARRRGWRGGHAASRAEEELRAIPDTRPKDLAQLRDSRQRSAGVLRLLGWGSSPVARLAGESPGLDGRKHRDHRPVTSVSNDDSADHGSATLAHPHHVDPAMQISGAIEVNGLVGARDGEIVREHPPPGHVEHLECRSGALRGAGAHLQLLGPLR